MIVLPEWRYNMMERMGMDMAPYQKAVAIKPSDPDRIVAYINRESRRKAARARRKR